MPRKRKIKMSSTRLTNEIRKGFLTAILRETFSPKFDEMQKRLTEYGKSLVLDQHPEFVKARKNEKVRPYVACSTGLRVTISKGESPFFRRPTRYDGTVRVDLVFDRYHRDDDPGFNEMKSQADHPYNLSTSSSIETENQISIDYFSLWYDFDIAQKTLRDTIGAYTIREKFEADFPSFVKYLPVQVKKISTAITIPIDDVMKKLSGVGIPSKDKK
jgi:hypothetical protein